jgi:hypothetical protein
METAEEHDGLDGTSTSNLTDLFCDSRRLSEGEIKYSMDQPYPGILSRRERTEEKTDDRSHPQSSLSPTLPLSLTPSRLL